MDGAGVPLTSTEQLDEIVAEARGNPLALLGRGTTWCSRCQPG
jgi:hypothetical protein